MLLFLWENKTLHSRKETVLTREQKFWKQITICLRATKIVPCHGISVDSFDLASIRRMTMEWSDMLSVKKKKLLLSIFQGRMSRELKIMSAQLTVFPRWKIQRKNYSRQKPTYYNGQKVGIFGITEKMFTSSVMDQHNWTADKLSQNSCF